MYQDLSSGCPLPLEAASLCASSTVPYSDSQAMCMAKVRRIAGLSLEVPLLSLHRRLQPVSLNLKPFVRVPMVTSLPLAAGMPQ